MSKTHIRRVVDFGKASKAAIRFDRFQLETLEDRSTPATLIGHGIDSTAAAAFDFGAVKSVEPQGVKTVFGTDDRILVADTTAAPYRSVVQLRMTFPNSTEEWIGTGSLVDSYHVLTAAHNMYDPELGGWATSIEVIPARNDAYLPFGVAQVTYKRTFDTFITTGDQNYDLGLLTLDRRIGNFTGIWTVGSWTNQQLTTTLNLAGYPAEIAAGDRMYRAAGTTASVDANMVYYNGTLDTSGGMSGGPVWAANPGTGERTLVAVHVAGAPSGGSTNAAVRLTSEKWSFFTSAMSTDNSIRPPTDLADLIDYDFWFGAATSYASTNSISSGSSFSITAKTFNLGTNASGAYSVSFYASVDKSADATDMLIGTVSAPSLAAFTAADVTWSGTFPQLLPGQSYMVWKIDSGKTVTEFSELNNLGSIGANRIAINQVGDVNDIIATALNVGWNPVYGNFTIARFIGDGAQGERDVDMYTFQGVVGARLTAVTSLPSGGANLDSYLRLFSANGTQLAFDDNSAGGTYAQLVYTLPTSGVYYLGVSGATNKNYNPSVAGSGLIGETGNYRLNMSLIDIGPGDVGDTISTAQATGLAAAGGTYSTVGRIGNGANSNKDVDMFRFDVIAGATLTAIAKLAPSGYPVDTYFRLFDSSGNQLNSDDDSANDLHFSYVQHTFVNGGTYYLGVSGYSNTVYSALTGAASAVGDTGEYQLVANILAPAMRNDIVGRLPNGQWWMGKSGGSSFTNQYWGAWSSGEWLDSSTGDFNGDGKLDVVGRAANGQWWVGISNGNAFANQLWGTWSNVIWNDVRVADFNADGRADIAGRYAGQWWVAISTGSSFINQYWGAWADTTWLDVRAADFDGDGRTDIAGRLSNGDWWVAHANAGSFTNQYYGRWASVTWNDVRVGDFDADGAADIVGRLDNGQVWVGLSRGGKFVNQFWVQWSSTLHWNNILTGDFNGDGRTDLAARCDCGNWYVSASTGESFFNSVWVGWSQVTWLDVSAGDFNGDGMTDIIGRLENGQWWVGASTGTRFANQYFGAWAANAGWTAVSPGAFTGVAATFPAGRSLIGRGRESTAAYTPNLRQDKSIEIATTPVSSAAVAATSTDRLLGRRPSATHASALDALFDWD